VRTEHRRLQREGTRSYGGAGVVLKQTPAARRDPNLWRVVVPVPVFSFLFLAKFGYFSTKKLGNGKFLEIFVFLVEIRLIFLFFCVTNFAKFSKWKRKKEKGTVPVCLSVWLYKLEFHQNVGMMSFGNHSDGWMTGIRPESKFQEFQSRIFKCLL